MQITPNHDLLLALGSAPSPPEPVRTAAANVTAAPATPSEQAAPRPEAFAARVGPDASASEQRAAAVRPHLGARVDILA